MKLTDLPIIKKDIRDMIEQKYLCDYTIHIPIFSNKVNNKNVCEYLIKNYRTFIVYCDSQKEGKEIRDIFNELQKGSAEYIDCNTNKRSRNDIINKYKNGDIPFLVNVRILTEGFDAPNTNGVIFMHLPSSKTTLIQIIGRALRLYKNKTYAKIILPFSDKEDEGNINNFLKVMARNDSKIRKSYESKTLGGYIELDKINIEGEDKDEDDNEIEFRYEMIYDKLGILQNNREIWIIKLDRVKQYINENHKRPSSIDKNIEIKTLGSWISNQQSNYKKKLQIMKDQEIYDKWTNFINDEQYINDHHKKPSYYAKK